MVVETIGDGCSRPIPEFNVLHFAAETEASAFARAMLTFLRSPDGRHLTTTEPRAELWVVPVGPGQTQYFASDGLLIAAADLELFPAVVGRVSADEMPAPCWLVVGDEWPRD